MSTSAAVSASFYQHLNFNLIRYGTWSRVDSCHHLHYALELATALTREEARHIIDEILRSDATRQLSYDGLKALMAIARRRLARFDDD